MSSPAFASTSPVAFTASLAPLPRKCSLGPRNWAVAHTPRCAFPTAPSDDGESDQPVRPPNFFGAYNPAELEALLDQHRAVYGDVAQQNEDDAKSPPADQPTGIPGFHGLVLDALEDIGKEKE